MARSPPQFLAIVDQLKNVPKNELIDPHFVNGILKNL
jgi:hypothetical protein